MLNFVIENATNINRHGAAQTVQATRGQPAPRASASSAPVMVEEETSEDDSTPAQTTPAYDSERTRRALRDEFRG